MKVLLVLNDPPYGTERSYNALRLARPLAAKEGTELRIFMMGDAVGCAVSGQKTPDGYYNLDTMVRSLARKRVSHRVLRHVHGCPGASPRRCSAKGRTARPWKNSPNGPSGLRRW